VLSWSLLSSSTSLTLADCKLLVTLLAGDTRELIRVASEISGMLLLAELNLHDYACGAAVEVLRPQSQWAVVVQVQLTSETCWIRPGASESARSASRQLVYTSCVVCGETYPIASLTLTLTMILLWHTDVAMP
jgi:hypothetical protein